MRMCSYECQSNTFLLDTKEDIDSGSFNLNGNTFSELPAVPHGPGQTVQYSEQEGMLHSEHAGVPHRASAGVLQRS